jgi:hypothetical protein
VIYHSQADTLLIRSIDILDEGGAYSKSITEAYLWNSKPFFFFKQTEGLYEGMKRELRIYIANGKVIRKLEKEGRFFSYDSGFIPISMDTIPNTTSLIKPDDYTMVIEFISNGNKTIKTRK